MLTDLRSISDIGRITERLVEALEAPERMNRLREAARRTAVEKFDLKRVLLPRWLALFEDLIVGRRPT